MTVSQLNKILPQLVTAQKCLIVLSINYFLIFLQSLLTPKPIKLGTNRCISTGKILLLFSNRFILPLLKRQFVLLAQAIH